jgi:hypothetical protein
LVLPWIKPGAVKRYDHVTINLMRSKRSGRQYSIDDADDDDDFGGSSIAKEIAAVVDTIPENEGVLIWTFKKSGQDIPDFESQLQKAIGPRANVWIDTFGRETATNAYKHVQNVIFTGCLELSPEKLAGMYIAETRDLTISVPSEDIDSLNRGEVWHRVYQALHRGACRGVFVDDNGQTQAKPMRVWIFTRHHKQIREELGAVLPGARWETWRPSYMSGGVTKEAKGAEVIKDILAKLAAEEKTKVSLKTLKGMHPLLVEMNVKMFQRARNLVLDDEDVGWRLDGRSLTRRSVEKRSFGCLEEEEDRPMPTDYRFNGHSPLEGSIVHYRSC